MANSPTADPSAAEPPEGADGNVLSVEPVAAHHGDVPRATGRPSVARLERLRRLVLEARVVALTGELRRARERRAAVIDHYEQIVDAQESSQDSPVFSWQRRD